MCAGKCGLLLMHSIGSFGEVLGLFLVLGEVTINALGEGSILESVGAVVVGRQRQDVHFVHFALHEVLERTVLLP